MTTHFPKLVGITIQIDFEYNSTEQKGAVRPLIHSNSEVHPDLKNQLYKKLFSLFNIYAIDIPVSFDDYEIKIDFMWGEEFEDLFNWISIDLDFLTIEKIYDEVIEFLESDKYQVEVVEELKKIIIDYLKGLDLKDSFKINVEVESIGYGPD